jgi:hypothetical protein
MTINDVRGALKGRVLLPGDDGFEQAARDPHHVFRANYPVLG